MMIMMMMMMMITMIMMLMMMMMLIFWNHVGSDVVGDDSNCDDVGDDVCDTIQ